ncbi:MAG: ABC-2 transporter permease [Clostridiaceae bacterium]
MKFFNKAIFYKEFKIAKWFLLVLTGEVLIFSILPFINTIQSIRDSIERGNYEQFNFNWNFSYSFNEFNEHRIFFSIIIIILASLIIGMDYSNRKYEFLTTLPFKRQEIIITKYITAIIVVVIPIIIEFITTLSLFNSNKDILYSYISYNILIKWFILNILVYIFILTFTMVIQLLCGKNLIGGILGSIFLVIPLGFSSLLNELIKILNYKAYTNQVTWTTNLYYKIDNLSFKLSPAAYNMNFFKYKNDDYYNLYDQLILKFPTRIIILIIVIAIGIYILYILFNKFPIERSGYILIYKPTEYILEIGISLCTGLLVGIIVAENLISKYSLYETTDKLFSTHLNYTVFFMFLSWIVTSIILFYGTHKVIELSKN